MGCQKLQGTCELLIKAFKRVYNMSCFDAFIESIHKPISESAAGSDPNADYLGHDFVGRGADVAHNTCPFHKRLEVSFWKRNLEMLVNFV